MKYWNTDEILKRPQTQPYFPSSCKEIPTFDTKGEKVYSLFSSWFQTVVVNATIYSKFVCSFNNTNTFTKTLFVVFSFSKGYDSRKFWMNENATPNIECHVNWYLFERSSLVPLGKFQFPKMHIKPKVKWRVVDSCISGYILQHKISFHCNAKAQKFIGFPFFMFLENKRIIDQTAVKNN